MKKVLIIPSPTGHGDLMVANELATGLCDDHDVATVLFDGNANSNLAQKIPGGHLRWSDDYIPDHSGNYLSQIRQWSQAIKEQGAEVVIVLNEVFIGLAALLAGARAMQVTHFLDRNVVNEGREALEILTVTEGAGTLEEALPKMVQAVKQGDASFLNIFQQPRPPLTIRSRCSALAKHVGRKLLRRNRARLLEQYRDLIGIAYLALILSDDLIVHSIFDLSGDALHLLNRDRAGCELSLVERCNPLMPSLTRNNPRDQVGNVRDRWLRRRARAILILVTFGGIDHPITTGFWRWLQILKTTIRDRHDDDAVFVLAGRVVETKQFVFEIAFQGLSGTNRSRIKFAGALSHEEHLQLLAAADLVITHPGYSTLCETAAMRKPCVIFYGLAPYYEQYANLVAATNAGVCIHEEDGQPLVQVGEYGLFGSPKKCSRRKIRGFLSEVLQTATTSPQLFKPVTERQAQSLRRCETDLLPAIRQRLLLLKAPEDPLDYPVGIELLSARTCG